jgi:pimeloyl-ACP methyl ester carboxylesterase
MTSNQIQFVVTKHGRLAYRIDGSGGDVPLVLLQRFRGTIDDWDPAFTASLTSSRRVIRFDSAGVGRSDGRTPESVSEMAEIARAFLKAINTNKADLLGWSMGGFIGQHAALDAPEIVRRLIIAGSGPGGVPEGPQPHPKVFEIATKPQSEDRDFLFLAARFPLGLRRSDTSGTIHMVSPKNIFAARRGGVGAWRGLRRCRFVRRGLAGPGCHAQSGPRRARSRRP